MHSNEKQPYRALLTGKRMLVITATGDAGYQSEGPLEQMNDLDPHICTAFAFIGITEAASARTPHDGHAVVDERQPMSVSIRSGHPTAR